MTFILPLVATILFVPTTSPLPFILLLVASNHQRPNDFSSEQSLMTGRRKTALMFFPRTARADELF
jgi:hypothetical protein